MPISRPRRIFRSALPRADAKGLVVLALLALIAAAGVSLAMLPHREPASSQPPTVVAEELHAPASQVAVVDGATLRLRDQVVRLLGVEPPSRGTTCEAADCGAAAINALAAMVSEVPVKCRLTGADAMGRAYAVCQAGSTELNRAVIAAGWGRAADAEPMLKQAEENARAQRRGLWALERDAGG